MQGSPLQQTMGHQPPVQGMVPQEALARMNQMQAQIEHLQGRVAQYEGADHFDPNKSTWKRSEFSPDVPEKARKAGKKRARGKQNDPVDPADGKTNAEAEADAQKREQEQRMSNETLRALGIDSMQEWRGLAGLPAESYAHPHEMPQPLIEDVYDGQEHAELSEEDRSQLWVEFLGARELSVEEFEAFVHEAFETGNEEDQEMVLALEDEFNSMLESEIDTSKGPAMRGAAAAAGAGITTKAGLKIATNEARKNIAAKEKPAPAPVASSVDAPTWAEFLGEKEISVQQFDTLCDEAIANDDQELMGGLLALEGEFHEQGGETKAQQMQQRGSIRGGSTKTLHLRQRSKPSGQKVKTRAELAKALSKFRGREMKPSDMPTDPVTSSKESIDRRQHVARLSEMEFDADSDPDGSPKIPWGRILKAYKVKMAASDPDVQADKGKDEGGMGGTSRGHGI